MIIKSLEKGAEYLRIPSVENIAAKIILERLKEHLERLIDPVQADLPLRSILVPTGSFWNNIWTLIYLLLSIDF